MTRYEMHHWTGRAPEGGYYHQGLVVPLSHRSHVVWHTCLRIACLDSLPPSTDVLVYWRHRVAFQLRLDDEPVTFGADSKPVLADLLDGSSPL